MSLAKQLVVSAILVVAGVAAWWAFERGYFSSDGAVTSAGPPSGTPTTQGGDFQGRRQPGQAGRTGPPGAGGPRRPGAGPDAVTGLQPPAGGPGAGSRRLEGRDRAGQAGRSGPPGGGRRGPGGFGRGATLVITAEVGIDTSGLEVRAIGTAQAARAVTIFPEITGVVEEVTFASGARVETGDVLIRLNAADQMVARDLARVMLDSARSALARAERLAQSNNITSVALADARTDVARAEIDLRDAEVDLAKRSLAAPFSGTIGMTDLTIGDLVTSSKAVANLDDLSRIKVEFDVPERATGLVKVNQELTATAQALPGIRLLGAIAEIDSRVDPVSRSLRVRATLPNSDGALKPGMAIAVVLRFAGEARTEVPSLAVQWDRDGPYVWKIVAATAVRTAVDIIGRRSGSVSVVGDIALGDLVVVEGLQRLRDGGAVTQAEPASAPATVNRGGGPGPGEAGSPGGPGGEAVSAGRPRPGGPGARQPRGQGRRQGGAQPPAQGG